MKRLLIIIGLFISIFIDLKAQSLYNDEYLLLMYKNHRRYTVFNSSINPYFALPDSGLTFIIGNIDTIFGDAFINVPIGTNLVVNYQCDIGTDIGADFVINPTISDIGYHRLICRFYQGSYFIGADTLWFNVIAKIPFGTKKIMLIGDSTTGADSIGTNINNKLDNSTLTFVGTIGSLIKNEGYPGATWFGLNTGTHGKFYDGSRLNVPAYFTTYTIDTPDYVYARIGINDVISSYYNESYVLGQSQILIDSILLACPNSKIIIAIPTIAENTGDGWMANYPSSSIQAMNYYIQKMHTYWQAIINKYANHAYSDRVDCSYGAVELNRDTGYPKIDGVHSNGVHPTGIGYAELGRAESAYFNRQMTYDYKPDSLTATWINDYDSISWYDMTGGLAKTELWLSCQDSAYRFVDSINAGTNYYLLSNLYQNANYKFKVRAKSGYWNSFFTNAISQNTPIVLKTDQTTPGTVTFSQLATQSQVITVSWGDGTSNDYSSTGSRNHTYSVSKNPYYITISGNVNDITQITISYDAKWSGDMSKLLFPSSIISFQLNGSFTGDISNWDFPNTLTGININSSSFTGDISSWNISHLTAIDMSALSTHLTGDLSNWNLITGTIRVYASGQDFTGIPRGELKNMSSAIGMYFYQNNCSQSEVDAFLVYADSYFTTNTPIQNCLFLLNGTGMAAPSSTGTAAISSIQSKFTTAGFTATITTN